MRIKSAGVLRLVRKQNFDKYSKYQQQVLSHVLEKFISLF